LDHAVIGIQQAEKAGVTANTVTRIESGADAKPIDNE
jgi:hypothetical protein